MPILIEKKCRKCGEEKQLNDFHKDERYSDGLQPYCKKCKNNGTKQWRKEHPLKAKAAVDKWRLKHPDDARNRIIANPDKSRKAVIKYRLSDPQRTKKQNRKYSAAKRKTIKGKLNSNMACHVWYSLRGIKGYRKWEKLTGYTTEQLISHLEKQFNNGMSWSNYGDWHIDHKIPLVAFNFKTAEDIDFKRAWDLNNLQPLWKHDNLSKGKKLTKPFQPALSISL